MFVLGRRASKEGKCEADSKPFLIVAYPPTQHIRCGLTHGKELAA